MFMLSNSALGGGAANMATNPQLNNGTNGGNHDLIQPFATN